MSKPDARCVIALSFGRSSDKSIIDINKEIAALASTFELPVITQKEVATHYPHPLAVITNPNGYLDTWKVLAEAKHIMDKKGFVTAELVAHKAHISRAEKYASKLGINYVAPQMLPAKWDRHSLQWWTRSSWQWQAHEMLNMPKLKLLNRI